MYYKVKDADFPYTLKGLTDAIKLAVEYAQTEPVNVFKVDEGNVSVVRAVEKQPLKKRGRGWNKLW